LGVARILVVDDELYFRNFVRRVLERAGHEVTEADGGAAALEAMKESAADILITDLLMPTGRGIDTITACRKRFPDTIIIAISGVGAYLPVARRLGAHHTLEKPINNRELVNTVAQYADDLKTPDK
jgi:two-component system chemotaxis response regulator CheY